MGHLELPATILPLDLAIEALVDIAIRLAPKTGKVGIARGLLKMAQEGLRATGANTAVYSFLAERIEGSWVDPNRYWRSEVVPQLATSGQRRDPICRRFREPTSRGSAANR